MSYRLDMCCRTRYVANATRIHIISSFAVGCSVYDAPQNISIYEVKYRANEVCISTKGLHLNLMCRNNMSNDGERRVEDMNDRGISIEIDGIYCPRCNALHPTLFWHDKYDDYINQSDYINRIIKAHERFGATISNDDAYKNFVEYLINLEIDKTKTKGKCVVCSAKTSFINKRTNHYVCSDECKYTDNSHN